MAFRSSLVLGVTAAAAALLSTVAMAPAVAAADGEGVGERRRDESGVPAYRGRPTCADEDRAEFPIDTRIRRGPAAYRPGGGPQEWTVDLTNATDEPCGNIHPVLVLVDAERTLTPEQVRLRFEDGKRWRPVPFEKTVKGENVGVFDDGFAGFTVAPGRTVSVKVRLAFTAGAGPNHVVASAALVQRRDGDGDWVGTSNDYSFDVTTGSSEEPFQALPRLPELADTGRRTPIAPVLAAAAAAVIGGCALMLGARRLRTGRPRTGRPRAGRPRTRRR
ncbi:hypothetical protein [Streptomyces sp. NPDC029674]|uniref:hypothetical protein n=1 Tax=Streptomyces sp. NPDC029674 TaxID=3365297 RepID=UPI00384E132C